MKDCAEQAAKAIAERDRRTISLGAHAADGWINHYSPKYNRCFLKAEYIATTKEMKGGPFLRINLIDAFEQAGRFIRRDQRPQSGLRIGSGL